MLSISAFNALLKTLEEPPERVIFILATTAPHKVPVTIRSRCQHIPFHGMISEQIVSRLETVAKAEGLEVQNEALWEIARNSEGGMRDALSLMEQAIAYGTGAITRETVDKLLGGGSSSSVRRWLSLCHENPAEALPNLESLFRSGAVPERFLSVLFTCVRNLWLQSRWGERVLTSLTLSEEERNWLKNEKSFFSPQHLERLMSLIASLLPQVRRGISNDVLCGLLVSWLMIPEPAAVDVPAPVSASEPTRKTTVSPKMQALQAVENAIPAPAERQAPLPSQAEVATNLQPAVTEETAKNVPSTTQPELDGLAVVNDQLKDALLNELSIAPQTVMPLLLSDILFDREKKTASLCLDEQDLLVFEALKDSRVFARVWKFLQASGVDAQSITVFCGEKSEVFAKPDDLPESVSASALPSWPRPADEDSAGFGSHALNDASFEAPPPNRFVIESSTPAVNVRRSGNDSLSNFLRGFMEGSLLYCRRNDESDEGGESAEE